MRYIRRAKHIIDNELIEKHKLLNHENEIIRKDAQERYDGYTKITSPKDRRRRRRDGIDL